MFVLLFTSCANSNYVITTEAQTITLDQINFWIKVGLLTGTMPNLYSWAFQAMAAAVSGDFGIETDQGAFVLILGSFGCMLEDDVLLIKRLISFRRLKEWLAFSIIFSIPLQMI